VSRRLFFFGAPCLCAAVRAAVRKPRCCLAFIRSAHTDVPRTTKRAVLLMHQQPSRSLLPIQHARMQSFSSNSLIHKGKVSGTRFAYIERAANDSRLLNRGHINMSRKLKVVAVSGSLQRPSRTLVLVDQLLAALGNEIAIDAHVLSLGEIGPQFAGVLYRNQLPAAVEESIAAIESADLLLVASPVYRGSYTGLFKHLFDFVHHEALTDCLCRVRVIIAEIDGQAAERPAAIVAEGRARCLRRIGGVADRCNRCEIGGSLQSALVIVDRADIDSNGRKADHPDHDKRRNDRNCTLLRPQKRSEFTP